MNISCISKFFSLKKLSPAKAKETSNRFVLDSKPVRYSITEIKKISEHIPEDAKTYSLAIIGKANDKNFKRNILTFYDENNRIIKRIFSGTDQPSKIREYNREFLVKNTWNDLIEVRSIKTKQYNPESYNWEVVQDENQYIKPLLNIDTHKREIAKKIHINKNRYIHKGNLTDVEASITEYPVNLGVEDRSAKKTVSAKLSIKDNIPVINSVLPETNVKVSLSDEFLPYRLLIGEQKQTSLTQYALNRKGLKPVNIGINFSKECVDSNSEGLFNHHSGIILYKGLSVLHPIKVAVHESEHAYQYSLIGRLGKLRSKYGLECEKKLGPVNDTKKTTEGYKYLIASEKYPCLSATEDLSKNEEYMNNYLEVRAREEADNVSKEYEKGRKVFTETFKYVPEVTAF